MPGVRCSGRKEARENLEFNKSLRWTRSCPRTGGVLYAGVSIAQLPTSTGKLFVLSCLPMRLVVIFLLLSSAVSFVQPKMDSLDQLASDFWTWRAKYRPFTFDDVARMEHIDGVRDWSAASIAKQRLELSEFEHRLKAMSPDTWPVAQKVDYRLMGSAIARVRWELDLDPRWRRDPVFYVEQTVVALQEELMPPPRFSEDRAREIVVRAENIPSILEQAKANLKPVRPCAKLAIDSLADIEARLPRVEIGVAPLLTSNDLRSRLHVAIPKAISALVEYRRWMKDNLPGMQESSAIGRDAYGFFLRQVALLPYTPEQLLTMARQDLDRVLAAQAYERLRNIGLPEMKMAANAEEEISRMARDEAYVRRYIVEHQILTVPSDLPHWTLRLAPDYIAAFDGFGELDDFTLPSRPPQDGVRWILPLVKDPSYFNMAYAKDTRTTGVHEGVPGHFFQLWVAGRNPDPIRRQYYDSGANEGIGFYSEEMMLQTGLYDNSPRSREIIYNFARLRALRVEIDVKLALGELTIPQAADYLARAVPMDKKTAETDAADYVAAPGLGIAYEIGKLQIERMLAERRLQLGDKFDLRQFHDYVWSNGNLPLSLQRWELLGLDDDMKALAELAN
jgi:uncharacterized protein (DUF885 family)